MPRHAGPLGRGERPVQHRHPDRGQHAAADSLQHSEGDQLEDRLGEAAEDRCGGEQGDRGQEGALGAGTVADPARRRDPDRQADEVADHHAVGRRRADTEAPRHRGKRDVDDRRIHDRHEHGDDIDRAHDLLGAQSHRAHVYHPRAASGVRCADGVGEGRRRVWREAARVSFVAWRSRNSGTSSSTCATSSGRRPSTATCSAGSGSGRGRRPARAHPGRALQQRPHASRTAAHRGRRGRAAPAAPAATSGCTTSGSRSATLTTSSGRRSRRCQEAGVRIVGTSDHTVTHSAYILDPDGNEIELYIDVAGVSWDLDNVIAPVKALVLCKEFRDAGCDRRQHHRPAPHPPAGPGRRYRSAR